MNSIERNNYEDAMLWAVYYLRKAINIVRESENRLTGREDAGDFMDEIGSAQMLRAVLSEDIMPLVNDAENWFSNED